MTSLVVFLAGLLLKCLVNDPDIRSKISDALSLRIDIVVDKSSTSIVFTPIDKTLPAGDKKILPLHKQSFDLPMPPFILYDRKIYDHYLNKKGIPCQDYTSFIDDIML